MHALRVCCVVALCLGSAPTGTAQPALVANRSGSIEAQRAWWRAFVVADTVYLRDHSAPAFSLTLSSGQTFDRGATLAEAAAHASRVGLPVDWYDEAAGMVTPDVDVVTARGTEDFGEVTHVYRYLTVLERSATGSRAVAAQTTRVLASAPRAPAAVVGPIADYAGAYRTPRGRDLRVVVSGSELALVEPSGAEIRLVPVGPALFELPRLSPANGVVRLLFTRDSAGRVTALSRHRPGGIETFPRTP